MVSDFQVSNPRQALYGDALRGETDCGRKMYGIAVIEDLNSLAVSRARRNWGKYIQARAGNSTDESINK